jgi:hypothetical protein
MSYNNVALAVIPSGIKSSIVYSLIGGNMTFARGSSATRRNKDGLIEYVPISVPRLDYDGAIPHLLLEPQRSNELQYSEDFSNAYWTKLNTTFESNANIAPDGNTTADAIYESSATGEHQVRRNSFSFSSSNPQYTFSVFAKYNGRNKFNLYSNNQSQFAINVNFDLELGVIASEVSGTGKIEDYGNGWYRCSATGTCSSSGTSNVTIRFRDDSNNTTYAGDIGRGVYIWGAQLEIGNHVTSYIPRLDTVAATRNADTCDSGTGDFNSNEGVLFVELEGLSDTYTANRYITLSDGTTSNMLYIRYSNTGELGITNVGPSLGSSVYSTNLDLSQRHKIAVKYGTQTSDYKVYINGSSVTISGSFSAQLMTGLNTLDFSYPTGSLQFYGKVRQAVVFNSGLTDSQLAELTR